MLDKEFTKKIITRLSRRALLLTSIGCIFSPVSFAAFPEKSAHGKKGGKNLSHKSMFPSSPHQTHLVKTQTAKTHIVKNRAPAIIGKAKRALPIIVLDPGHGGKDPGAIGYSGTYEKHVAYATAVELSRQLMKTGRYQVHLTRNADHFIPLNGRVEIAQQKKASLFISMHADALHNSSVRGASVYTLSRHASDKQSAALASVENSADRYGGADFHATSPEVEKILAGLVKLETKRESAAMAQNIVLAFNSRVGLLPHPKRQAGFVVLKSIDIPSILVEMGFMSNRRDEAALRQASYRQLVAASMRNAIDRYFAIGGSVTHMT